MKMMKHILLVVLAFSLSTTSAVFYNDTENVPAQETGIAPEESQVVPNGITPAEDCTTTCVENGGFFICRTANNIVRGCLGDSSDLQAPEENTPVDGPIPAEDCFTPCELQDGFYTCRTVLDEVRGCTGKGNEADRTDSISPNDNIAQGYLPASDCVGQCQTISRGLVGCYTSDGEVRGCVQSMPKVAEQADQQEEKKSENTGAIVGGVIGGIVAGALIVGIVYVAVRKYRKSKGLSFKRFEDGENTMKTDSIKINERDSSHDVDVENTTPNPFDQ